MLAVVRMADIMRQVRGFQVSMSSFFFFAVVPEPLVAYRRIWVNRMSYI